MVNLSVTLLCESFYAVRALKRFNVIVDHKVVFQAAFSGEFLPTAFELTKEYLARTSRPLMKLFEMVVACRLLDKFKLCFLQQPCNLQGSFVV